MFVLCKRLVRKEGNIWERCLWHWAFVMSCGLNTPEAAHFVSLLRMISSRVWPLAKEKGQGVGMGLNYWTRWIGDLASWRLPCCQVVALGRVGKEKVCNWLAAQREIFPSVGGSSEAYSLEGCWLVIIYAFCQLLYPDLDLLLASLRESLFGLSWRTSRPVLKVWALRGNETCKWSWIRSLPLSVFSM